jgi:large subunit ribosomal protein L25
MSTDTISVDLQERTVLGKGLAALRAEGQIPAVIHDHGNPSIHVMGDAIELRKVYAAAGKHHPVEIKVGGKQHLALIKDADFKAVKHQLRHLVFQAIKQDEEVEAEVPVVFLEGADVPAERASLLVLKQLDHVEIKALPKDLPNELVVDPSTLIEVGDSLSVADIKVPAGVIITTDEHAQIAIVEMPKDQLAEADAAAAALAEDAAAHADEEEAETPAGEPAAEGEAEAGETTEAPAEEA